MILFYGRMLAPKGKYSPTKVYLTTSNPYDHWVKKLYRIYNKQN